MLHNSLVPEFKGQITELAELMDEFGLGEAQIQTEDIRIAFRRRGSRRQVVTETIDSTDATLASPHEVTEEAPEPTAPKGTPIASPMNGIFYGSPSPASPPFVKEGESISAGQVVGLIEAMKVFNEIPSPVSGVVLKLVAETGAIVQPGDVLLYVRMNEAVQALKR